MGEAETIFALSTAPGRAGIAVVRLSGPEAGAALDAHIDAQIERRLGATPDHPVLLSFPEGDYLKGLVCRRLS